jgi:lipopolysaccharide/colanic/teichoic acid biosynthesis glycosyltransferase
MHDWMTTFQWSEETPIARTRPARSRARARRRPNGLMIEHIGNGSVTGSLSIASMVESQTVEQTNGRSSVGPDTRTTPRFLGESLFRSALVRERRRADRFDEQFALITIKVDPWLLPAVRAAVAAAASDIDMMGWMEQGTTVGVILTEISPPGDADARQFEACVLRELMHRLDAVAIERLEIRCYVHRGPGADAARQLSESDPLLHELRSMHARLSLWSVFKRTLDITGSAALLVLMSPVFLLAALLVKLTSRGPVLFKQERIGYMARPFTMLKFRTMQVNNDPALHRQYVTAFIKSNGHARTTDEKAPFKIDNDPRTTAIGRLLRRTSMDELPQLWNVLRGDMSLVGPRPPIAYELEHYQPWHWRRVLEARPGLTGLWQIAGRSRTTFDEMVRLDLRYARAKSLWLDLKILLATPRAVISGRGAR